MKYLERLQSHQRCGSLIAAAESRVLLLTGQSSFSNALLSPEQKSFLRAVVPECCEVTASGFPYRAEFLRGKFSSPGMVAASVRNGLQVMWSLWHPGYRRVLECVLQEAIDATSRRLVLITGSCGLQLANVVWPKLRLPSALRVDVIALGPVCFGTLRLQGAQVTVLQGHRDEWSKLFYWGSVDVCCACGHLDYWTSMEVRQRVTEILKT
jgi:hypothetical protein